MNELKYLACVFKLGLSQNSLSTHLIIFLKVINTVFSFLKMLQEKGPVESIFREIEKIEQLSFDFGEESQVSILLHQHRILYLIYAIVL